MNIPLREDNTEFDCCVRLYRRAILNTLIELKPKYCLEIGTHIFQSSKVFSYYLDKYCPEGKLITVDVGLHDREEIYLENVYPLMVYPHYADVEKDHGGLVVYYPDYKEGLVYSAVFNTLIIQSEMNKHGIKEFDFTFVDGGHTKTDIIKDIQIAKYLTKPNGYLLIDDIKDGFHSELVEVYKQWQNNGNIFYEFEKWSPDPGMALIRNKDLRL